MAPVWTLYGATVVFEMRVPSLFFSLTLVYPRSNIGPTKGAPHTTFWLSAGILLACTVRILDLPRRSCFCLSCVIDRNKLRSTTLRSVNVSKRRWLWSRSRYARCTVSCFLRVGLLLIGNILPHDITKSWHKLLSNA
jgi:hypothetical protein